MNKYSDCKVCFGISKSKCILCGEKAPKKKDLSDAELAEYENWVEFVNYHNEIVQKMRKFNQWSTKCGTLDQKLYDLFGYWRRTISKPRELKFMFMGEEVLVKMDEYSNGRRAVLIESVEGFPLATLSTNLPEHKLDNDEFFVKDWSENASIAAAAKASGLFLDTGKTVRTGFVTVQIWRF